MNNLDVYDKFRVVPATAQKTIKGGSINGFTDINPMWRIQCLTEEFGMCGVGWYTDITKQWMEMGSDGKVAAFCNINLYVKVDGEWSKPIVGTGGSAFVNIFKDKPTTSDEAYKMAYTDAISVACKALGIGADVYWSEGRTKYSVNQEQSEKAKMESDPKKVQATGYMVSTLQKNAVEMGISEKVLFYNLQVKSWDEITVEHFNRAMKMFEAEKAKRGNKNE